MANEVAHLCKKYTSCRLQFLLCHKLPAGIWTIPSHPYSVSSQTLGLLGSFLDAANTTKPMRTRPWDWPFGTCILGSDGACNSLTVYL